MKYLLPFILFVGVGCAGSMSSYQGKGGPFNVQKKSEPKAEKYYLLSIRDSGYVVAPARDDEFAIEEMLFIHKDSVLKMQHIGRTGLSASGGIIGVLVGGTAGALLAQSANPFNVFLDRESDGALTVFNSALMVVGATLGSVSIGLLGAILGTPQNTFDLSDPKDRETLTYLCKYCGQEPEIIDSIK